MTSTPQPADSVAAWAHRQAEHYRGDADRPLGSYLGMLAVYTGGVGALAALGRVLGRRAPERIGAGDLGLLAVATHRLARTIAKDPITSPLRAPFTRFDGTSAAGELAEDVRGHGLRHSVGELIACPMCLAQWVATALSAGLVFAPRQTRLVMTTLSAVAGADFLQYLYAYLQQQVEG
jgi:hypothetical protein